jgi:hypothetical protein
MTRILQDVEKNTRRTSVAARELCQCRFCVAAILSAAEFNDQLSARQCVGFAPKKKSLVCLIKSHVNRVRSRLNPKVARDEGAPTHVPERLFIVETC